jgi:hypothetical protein
MSDLKINQSRPTPYELLEYRKSNAFLVIDGLASVIKDSSKMDELQALMDSAGSLEEGADGSFLGQ